MVAETMTPAAEEASLESDRIAEAKTVIRGSSRVEQAEHRLEPMERSPAAVAKVLLGQRLNHFLLEELIGGGGMGAVFRAHDEQLDRTVAIKVIPFVGNDPDLRRRFRNEAQSAAKLDHPRIARVFDVGSHGDWHYIVFEYIEGTNVRDLVTKNGVLSIDDAVFYTSQLADALQHAADRGIVHRDIKPSNVLIGPDEVIKLVDMGLARSDNLDLSEDMTASGVTLGTFDYISPEQAHDPRDADLRSDIYSLGCTLYFMLTGSPPYPGGTMLQKLLSHGNSPPPDVRALRPEVSDNLAAVIEKMLAKKPADRYQTATDLIADLREVAFRDGLIRSQTLSPVTITPSRPLVLWLEKHAPWIVALMLLVASAGWLQLESAAYRDEVTIPSTAQRPQAEPTVTTESAISVEPTAVEVEPVAEIPATPQTGEAGQAESKFGPPEQPPEFADIRAPAESLEDTEIALDSTEESERSPDSFANASESIELDASEPQAIGVVRVVAPDYLPDFDLASEGIVTANSLAEALDLATQYESTSRIEIAVPVVVCSEPVRVEVDDLLITSTVGGSTIVFQPVDSVAMARSKMFSIGSHPIVFEDLHFVWNVPSGDLDGGTLFELHHNDLVRFTDCTITVSNPTLRDEVYAFDVITDPNKLPRRDAEVRDQFPHVWLELNNVIVRGQMTMLHMDYAAKLWLDWDNGLLAVTQRMIDTAGARLEPVAAAGPIRLKLWRITAHAPEGIFLMRVGVSGAYPVPVDRLAHECVFLIDPGNPHYDFRGLATLSGLTPLRLQGASNAYVTDTALSDPMLRMLTADDQRESTLMEDLLSASLPWAMDKSPRWTVDWQEEPLTDAPVSQRAPADYRQRDESPLGFDEKALPSLPDSSETDPESVRSASRSTSNRGDL
jgi:serine/threonine-protein kinase